MPRNFLPLLAALLLFLLPSGAHSTHLMGGELTYRYDSSVPGYDMYEVKLIIYRYCDTSVTQTAQLDDYMNLGVYPGDPQNPGAPLACLYTEYMDLVSSDFLIADPQNPLCNFSSTACIQRGEYIAVLALPVNPGGYHLIVERCCRNNNIININNPGGAGMSFYGFIPSLIVNSSPQITDVSVPYICSGDTVSLVNNAYDPDGDSLVYSFVVPYNGYSSGSVPIPDPSVNNNPYVLPIQNVMYAPGYSIATPFGVGGYAYIDPLTGLTQYFIPNQGFYVAAVEIREYRNGVLISSMRRDLQFISIVCPQNDQPQFDITSAPGTIFTVGEGATLCFNTTFIDPDGDTLYLVPSGPLLDSALVNPAGTMAATWGSGTVTGQFCWTPACGMIRSTPYQFSVTVTDNGCPAKSTSEIFSVYVEPGPATLNADVSFAQSPPGLMCQGSLTTFVATATMPGNNPQFFWTINGLPVGTNNDTFSTALLNDGDIIALTMVSSEDCLLFDTVYAAPFIVNMSLQPAPQVSITSSPADTLCPQQLCNFSASLQNGGATPIYQWHFNGLNAGANISSFNTAGPAGTFEVYLTVIPSTGCPPQISDTILMTVLPQLTPGLNLVADHTDSICPGQPVLFTASSSSTGLTPFYSWYMNGAAVASGNNTLLLPSLAEGASVTVSVTSDYPCLSPLYTYTDTLVYHLYEPLAIDMTNGPLEVCLGTPVALSAQVTGGNVGTLQYDWTAGAISSAAGAFIPITSGYYFASAEDACFNPVVDSIFIEVLPVPVTDFSWTPVLPNVFDPHVDFTDRSLYAISWLWDLDDQATSTEQHPEHTYSRAGLFQITLVTTNDVGCTDTMKQTLEVEEFLTIYVPNSFTPNLDGKNETFGMSGFSADGYSLSIFNRWGQEVFRSVSDFDEWDGTTETGDPAPTGTYVYQIRIKNDPAQQTYTGTVTLFR